MEIRKREKWILGDFKVNLENRNSPDALLVNKFFKDNSLKQLITSHTRLTNKGGSCIDWIVTDSSYIYQSGILDELLSDHNSIFVVRKKGREVVCRKRKKIRTYKNFDSDVFRMSLTNNDWNTFYMVRNVNTFWKEMYSKINDILEIMCPYKIVYLRDPKTPWITDTVIKTMNERKKYIKLFRKTKNKHIFEICKYLRNRCNSLVRHA